MLTFGSFYVNGSIKEHKQVLFTVEAPYLGLICPYIILKAIKEPHIVFGLSDLTKMTEKEEKMG